MDKKIMSDTKIIEKVLFTELLEGKTDLRAIASRIACALHGVNTETKHTEDAE